MSIDDGSRVQIHGGLLDGIEGVLLSSADDEYTVQLDDGTKVSAKKVSAPRETAVDRELPRELGS